ncbi:hypothetical protein [Mycobacteroides abscessus]|uniref:hypothetical protein n=1 Tax=Mycobacteroides abscessus TaxID=36809 RepID=UPI0009A68FF7|nr:hypothetical protein [Mycobacteroides abscessus]SKK38794.1 Uncharacterised protein [Mycobacteroides abscessus subsp. massiliense]SKM36122.1 Uncharacterised protein [Mycobacteroides abscessus subsp. massiliense]SKP10433.1 Uncharacterised protein [Mycobacteroides abscessus subsp. massiliense]SKP95681.1 Uncharacterised protein [Mycobacteroides abscessus subsp. massiliense]SLK59011.1 Uncharacterised protein [Mycobacteroides abscessus subsp. massiliense]
MEFTEVSNDDGVATIVINDRGVSGKATVSLYVHVPRYDNDNEFVTPAVHIRFQGLVTINNKDYDAWRCSADFAPGRWGDAERKVLTDKGFKKVLYSPSAGGTFRELTDSARKKLEQLAAVVADRYLTTEASKAAIVGAAKYKVANAVGEKEKAEAEVQERVAELDSARAYLAQMEQL